MAPSSPSKPISLEQLLGMEFKPEDFIIAEGILNKGSIMFIGGPPKSYKSFILNSLIENLCTGSPLFGIARFPISKPQRVLMLEQEIGYLDLQARMKQTLTSMPTGEQGLLKDNLSIISCDHNYEFSTDLGTRNVETAIIATNPDIVALDPFVEFHTEDENSAQAMMKVFHRIDRLREKYGVTIIITHHVMKTQRDDPRQGPSLLRGSGTIFAKGDSYLMVDPGPTRNSGLIRSEFTLRRGKPIDNFYLQIDFSDLRARFSRWGYENPTAAASSHLSSEYRKSVM